MVEQTSKSHKADHPYPFYKPSPTHYSRAPKPNIQPNLVTTYTTTVDGTNIQHKCFIVAVIPAFNEDRFIGSVVLKTKPFVDRIVIVDDGSTDQTSTVACETGAEVIVHENNQGKGKALKTGFTRALDMGADIVVMLDGDGQHNPQEIPSMVWSIAKGQADMVIGSRFQDVACDAPTWRRVGQHVLTFLTNTASGVASSDSQSGFRAFSRQALTTLDIRCGGFAVESELQFWACENDLRVVEVPISCVYAEKSKRNPIRHGLQVVNGILELVSQMRPLLFFGISGLFTALAGTGWWCWILRTFNNTGELALGYALLATLLIILGVLAIFQGVTLHTLRYMMDHLPKRPETYAKDAQSTKTAEHDIALQN